MVPNYFDLGDIFYDSCRKSCLNKLQTLQNNALHCIYLTTTDKRMSIQEMHKKAGLLLLEQRRKLNHFKYDHIKNPSLRLSTRINLAVPRPNKV